jgi:hypothetical protein
MFVYDRAQRKAKTKYQNKVRHTIKTQFNVEITRTLFDDISQYCQNNAISKSQFLAMCYQYLTVNNRQFNELNIKDIYNINCQKKDND